MTCPRQTLVLERMLADRALQAPVSASRGASFSRQDARTEEGSTVESGREIHALA